MAAKIITECPKIYRKSVLHLLRYRLAVYLSLCTTDMRKILKFWDRQYVHRRSELDNLICLRNFCTSKAVSNLLFILNRRHVNLHVRNVH